VKELYKETYTQSYREICAETYTERYEDTYEEIGPTVCRDEDNAEIAYEETGRDTMSGQYVEIKTNAKRAQEATRHDYS